MRFLILTQYYPPEIGAAPTRLPSVAAELKRLGHEVEVVTGMPNYPSGRIFPEYRGSFYRREVRDGIVLHRVWLYAAIGRTFERALNYGSFALTSIFGLMRARKPHYVFLESPPLFLSVPAVIAARFWRVPLAMNVADLWPDAIVDAGILKEGILVRVLTTLERWAYRNATSVTAVTEGIRDFLIEQKSLAPRKVLFLPNGVDTSRFQPQKPDEVLKRELGLEGKKVIIWAGTQGQSHALEHVIEAAKLLRDQPEIHFLFVGDGTARPQMERLKADWWLRNVSFHDPVTPDRLASFFSIAECGLVSLRDIPMHNGARPSKIFPILASGKPIVFVGRGEGAELIARADAGVVVAPGDPTVLAEAITTMFEQPEIMKQQGMNGRRFVEANLRWPKLVADWIYQLSQSNSEYEGEVVASLRNDVIPIQRETS